MVILKIEYKKAFLEPKLYLIGAAAGVLNGLLGAGGGLVVVPMLLALSINPQKAHATSIAIILPLSLFSIAISLISGAYVDWLMLLKLIPAGLIGAAVGGMLLPKIKGIWLTKIFGAIMIYSGLRILLRDSV